MGIARGFRYAGLEAHPEIAELAQLKVNHFPRPQRILEHAERLVHEMGEVDTSQETALVSRSFRPDTLQQLVSLRNQLKTQSRRVTSRYLKWCLLGTLRDCAAVQVRWPYQRPKVPRKPRIADPIRAFLRRAHWMAEDLHHELGCNQSYVIHGDARSSDDWDTLLKDNLANAVVTSPPYLNNFDYADATRLETYFWGVATTWAEMVSQVRVTMLTATTQQTRKDVSHAAMAHLRQIAPRTSSTIESPIQELEGERSRRPRGKEYDRVIAPYFSGMSGVLVNVYNNVLPGAHIVFVIGDSAPYGVHLDTPTILGELAQELNFDLIETKILRSRGTRWLSTKARHQIPLAESLVVLRRPDG